MNADDPRHGTRAGYLAHRKDNETPCPPCNTAHRTYCKRYELRAHQGYRPRIDATPTRDHINNLIAKGMTMMSIARAAGVAHSVIWRIRADQPTVTRKIAADIAAVTAPTADRDKSLINSEGSRRRLHALQRNGFPLADIARAIGIERRTLSYVSTGARKWVTANTAKAIDEFYEAHWDKEPESRDRYHSAAITRTTVRAQTKRFAPAQAWDDIDDCRETAQGVVGWNNFRDPNSVDPMVVERILGGDWRLTCTRAEKEEVCARFMAAGGSSKTLGELTSWKIDRYWRRSDAA